MGGPLGTEELDSRILMGHLEWAWASLCSPNPISFAVARGPLPSRFKLSLQLHHSCQQDLPLLRVVRWEMGDLKVVPRTQTPAATDVQWHILPWQPRSREHRVQLRGARACNELCTAQGSAQTMTLSLLISS